ncbi:hypothetical protein M885DRAFT_499824 [Pelagophyceae sp. CCMP2097]|nr:hypothetical protein M885DRAFT_499824 [Pelagophyceae sp. CCMP2097]
MVDRFAGFRYEVEGEHADAIVETADELGCFGWAQLSSRSTTVGEVRCAKAAGPSFKAFLGAGATFFDYADTKIKLHFSHFKILPADRQTCFREPPHQCEEYVRTRPSCEHEL